MKRRRIYGKQPPPPPPSFGRWTLEIPLIKIVKKQTILPKALMEHIMGFVGGLHWSLVNVPDELMQDGPLLTIVRIMNFVGSFQRPEEIEMDARAVSMKHLFKNEHQPELSGCIEAAGYVLSASLLRLSPQDREELMLESTIEELALMPEGSRNLWRELFHVAFCVTMYTAVKTHSKRGYDEALSLYSLFAKVCSRSSLRPFRFYWGGFTYIREQCWPDDRTANALGSVVQLFWLNENWEMYDGTDWRRRKWNEGDLLFYISLLDEDGVDRI